MKNSRFLWIFFLSVLVVSLGLSACGGGDDDDDDDDSDVAADDDASDDDGDDDDGASVIVDLIGETQILPGGQLDLTVHVTGDCADPRFMLEQVDQGKTTWQSTRVFTVIMETVGEYDFVAHVKCGEARYAAEPLEVRCVPADLSLRADRQWVESNSGDKVLFQVDAGSRVVDSMTLENTSVSEAYTMVDDGTHGDPVAEDNIFSYRLTTDLGAGNGAFQATATTADALLLSNWYNLPSVAIPADGDVEQAYEDLELVNDYSKDHAVDATVADFISAYPDDFSGAKQIRSIGRSDDYIRVEFKTGTNLFLTFTPEGRNPRTGPLFAVAALGGIRLNTPTRAAAVSSPKADKDAEPVFIKNYKSLIYSANYSNRVGRDDGETIKQTLSGDERFTDGITWLQDQDVTVDSMTSDGRDWRDYGVLVFNGHGTDNGYWVLGERRSLATHWKYKADMALGNVATFLDSETTIEFWIVKVHPTVYGVKTSWIASQNDLDLNGTFFYTGACYGGRSIARLFPEPYRVETTAIGSALFGFDDVTESGPPETSPTILPARAGDLFTNLLDGYPLGDSYSADWDVNRDPDVTASPVVSGNPNLLLGTDGSLIVFDDFESYPLDQPLDTENWEVYNKGAGTTYVRKPTAADTQAVVFVDPQLDAYSRMRVFFNKYDVRQGRLDFEIRPSAESCAGVRFEDQLDEVNYWPTVGPYAVICDWTGEGLGVDAWDAADSDFARGAFIDAGQWQHITMIFDVDTLRYDLLLNGELIVDDAKLASIQTIRSLRFGTFSDEDSSSNTYFDNVRFVAYKMAPREAEKRAAAAVSPETDRVRP
ncbi:hypothetical protein KDL45_06235 [bacterium]|nr:hypothetical protein [bacterium]